MSCLVPQFKCPPDIFAVKFRSQSHLHTSKRTEGIDFQTNCALITTPPPTSVIDFEKLKLSSSLEAAIPNSSLNDGSWIERTSALKTALLDLEKIPSLDAYPVPLASDQTWTYVGGIGSPSQVLDKESLLTSEEAIIAAAASEALALAKAAVQVAKDAAVIINNRKSIKPNGAETGTLPIVEASSVGKNGTTKLHWSGRDCSSMHEESDDVEPAAEELEILEVQLSENITVRSKRQTERKDRRTRAAEKMSATTILPLKSSTSSARKKRSPVQEIDHSDPLRYLRGITTSSKLLNASEEQELSKGIQVLLKLERLHEELKKRFDGGEPTFSQWASAAGVDQKTLRKQLNHGTLCKDRMIKSNLRLVVSIAKNYQGCGMNLQDLVQEGCRGLVRGAEKFDASKGFKFSTYAHWWIKQAVRKSLSDHSRTIRLP
ncbi:sigma factor, partial [Genlisea aurea]